ncbi:PspC domain-containing protein [Ligilactobacillus ceti]|uniref:Phage shock protein PspC N-terminal domain-containing protein n=1 Tax=Ligilactobacillus ceti DSM 22408 TaxID=1122146 RepID=A0A0R2KLK4_9LACO|nr:PspC domain-containing protein [Ligilactobacillus ceti]KRN90329.1 hypothetical protein IV53_GL000244 [Ligilactobacillus ceti DSM 22408]
MAQKKKLIRPIKGRMLLGVCAGLGRYFKIDPKIIRVAWLVLLLLGFISRRFFLIPVLAYCVLFVLMPAEKINLQDYMKSSFSDYQEQATPEHDERTRKTLTDVQERDLK